VELNSILLSVLLVLASVLAIAGVWALVEAVRTARSVRVLADDLDARAVPLLEKADVTVDAVNAELLRMDAVVSRIEDITDRVESTTRTVQGVASAPAELVSDIAERVRRAWKRHQAEAAAQAAAQAAAREETGSAAEQPEAAQEGAAPVPDQDSKAAPSV
jgi:hypothetical protein